MGVTSRCNSLSVCLTAPNEPGARSGLLRSVGVRGWAARVEQEHSGCGRVPNWDRSAVMLLRTGSWERTVGADVSDMSINPLRLSPPPSTSTLAGASVIAVAADSARGAANEHGSPAVGRPDR